MSAPSIFTEFFGPCTWKALHSAAFNYAADPGNPTKEERSDAAKFFGLWEKFIPCPSCRKEYGSYLKKHPVDASSRDNLTRWLYDLHSNVNRRTRKENITYEEHVRDYAGWDAEAAKRYMGMSRRQQLKALADPHFGRPVGGGSVLENMVGKNETALASIALAIAFAAGVGYLVYTGKKEKEEGTNEEGKKRWSVLSLF